MSAQSHTCQVRPHGSEIRSPHGKLQEVHDNQSKFHIHCSVFSGFNDKDTLFRLTAKPILPLLLKNCKQKPRPGGLKC